MILIGDCRDVLKTLDENSIDACVTDPPYGLSFMGKSWDYDVPSADTWREVYRVLKPGAHLLSFFGSRTYHRGVVQIEDAGFEIRDQIMWVYGSGFPKSLDVSKAIDKAAATDAARQWDGWGTALKPSHEPIVVARKPLIGTVAENVQRFETGAINIDGCRISTSDDLNGGAYAVNGKRSVSQSLHGNTGMNQPGKTVGSEFCQPTGRWPANLIHDGSDEVLAGFPSEAGAAAPVHKLKADKFRNSYGALKGNVDEAGSAFRNDKGSAARFFYCAKASRSERGEGNNHPTVKPLALMHYLVRLVTPPGGTVIDPFAGSGSTILAALAEGFKPIGVELDPKHAEVIEARLVEYLV